MLLFDVITKRLVEANLLLLQPKEVLGDFFRLTLSYNTGAAFGISVLGNSRWIYVGLTLAILVALWTMYRDAATTDRWQALALGLITGGALGNLVDRVRATRGVVDFIDVGIGDRRFWTFNIADSGITVGASIMVVLFLFHSRRQKSMAEATAQTPRSEHEKP